MTPFPAKKGNWEKEGRPTNWKENRYNEIAKLIPNASLNHTKLNSAQQMHSGYSNQRKQFYEKGRRAEQKPQQETLFLQ